ncbi:uncharacterized protein LOC135686229 [Rhopilema esculentum]|uniref:uncharacterized protein LOC135686229 n=1 Tax=Rhopilema esculentum TaxID=499914 RepID=UPI0031DABC9B
MLYFLIPYAVIAAKALLGWSATEGLLYPSSKDTCIRNASASVVKIQNPEILGIQIKWFVEDNALDSIEGFHLYLLTSSGLSRSFFIKKKITTYSIKLPKTLKRVEQYRIHLGCTPLNVKNRIKMVINPKDICEAYSRYKIPAPFQCLRRLKNVSVRKCFEEKAEISWSPPDVYGHIGYVIRKTKVNCIHGSLCCKHAEYQRISGLHLIYSNTTTTSIEEGMQYCIEILMCPAGEKKLLNCESKHPPLFIKCPKTRRQHSLLVGTVAALALFFCIACIYTVVCFIKRRKAERESEGLGLKSLSTALIQSRDDDGTKRKEPMMFIVHCAGCVVLEEFVLHLIRFFRLNGINAVSELTEEESVFKYGRGVFLNEMLSKADIVFVLCTDVMDNVACNSSYICTRNAVQNKVVEHGDDLSHYFMAHFNKSENVPDMLRLAGLDLSKDLRNQLEKTLLRVFDTRTYLVGEKAVLKNKIELCGKAKSAIADLQTCSSHLLLQRHSKCLLGTCPKGDRV